MFKWIERRKEKLKMIKQYEQNRLAIEEIKVNLENMLCLKTFITVLEGYSSEELTQKFNELKSNDKAHGRVGEIYSIDDKNFTSDNGKHLYQIE